MPRDKGQSREVDLERTDRLPLLDGNSLDHDAEDYAVRMETVSSTVVLPVVSAAPGGSQKADFPRASGGDLPSLAQSVRSVEERIARQAADFETLNRSYDKARDALETEQSRAREIDRALTEKSAAAEAARARAEESVRDSERHHSEARTLRDTLGARDAAIAQALHALDERETELIALQKERAETVPLLEARARTGAQLEADLRAARHALSLANSQATAYLEQLRTREYRRGFDQNLLRELDARVGAAKVGQGALEAQRDQLRQQVGELQSKLASQDDVIATLQANAGIDAVAKTQHAQQLQQRELARAALSDQIEALESERAHLNSVIAGHAAALAEARASGTAEVQRVEARLKAVEGQRAQLSTAVVMLREEAEAREVEMAVMVANLQDARRPAQPIAAEVKRLTDELARNIHTVDQLNKDNHELKTELERTKSALQERESVIRRLERNESSNVNVFGRIQHSIEQLGAASASATATAAPVECSAELVRLSGGNATSHVLGRRTRIGRAAGCELQIDYSSVSRHHALVLMGPRDVIIEDMNSTNGVIVNGRKISRQLLNDGDLIVIGEVQFRVALRLAPRAAEPVDTETPGGTATG